MAMPGERGPPGLPGMMGMVCIVYSFAPHRITQMNFKVCFFSLENVEPTAKEDHLEQVVPRGCLEPLALLAHQVLQDSVGHLECLDFLGHRYVSFL